jgi:hypothetical protein
VTAGVEYTEDNKTEETKPSDVPSNEKEVSTESSTTSATESEGTSEESSTEDTSVEEEEATESPIDRCFTSTDQWQKSLLRRIIVTEDNVKYQLASMIGKKVTARRELLRRGLRNLMILERVVQAAGTPTADTTEEELDSIKNEGLTTTEGSTTGTSVSRDEEAMKQTLLRSERNLNRIGWVIYRGRSGWQFKDCCLNNDIHTMCGERKVKTPA